MERWWFHMIAGADGEEEQIRVVLRAGEDEGSYPAIQVALDGTEVPVDDAPVDYEAPEWKAKQLFAPGDAAFDAIKERLREQAS